jgi:hypothetical protein
VKRGPGRPPKIKEDTNLTEVTSEDEQDIDVCGFDDSETDTDKDGAADNVFSSQHYSQKHKHHSTKRKPSDVTSVKFVSSLIFGGRPGPRFTLGGG